MSKTLHLPSISITESSVAALGTGGSHRYIVEVVDNTTHERHEFSTEFQYWDAERAARRRCYTRLGKWLAEEVQVHGRS